MESRYEVCREKVLGVSVDADGGIVETLSWMVGRLVEEDVVLWGIWSSMLGAR